MIIDTKIAATIDGSEANNNNYKINYKLSLTGQNKTQTDVNWYLLKSGSGQAIESVIAPDCELKTDATSGTTKYWYATSQEREEQGTCSAKSYISSKLSDTQLVAWGKIAANSDSQTLTAENGEATALQEALTQNTPSGLDNEFLYTKSDDRKHTEEYYYLVVEYPNKSDQPQNDDMNKVISISIDSITDVTSTLVTE